ncbi:MAG: hypothetical protein O7H39_17350 [Gammaproteobacteria bacterium]|nr:hypothetical protein [Gammaproteobacteria bacterium]
MDFLGYMAAGGVERIAIVGAALLVIYFGYKLYVSGLRQQIEEEGLTTQGFVRSGTGPGILFMGVGCTVLIIMLVTGGNHLRTAGEAYRAAGPVNTSDASDASDTPADQTPTLATMSMQTTVSEPEPIAVESDPFVAPAQPQQAEDPVSEPEDVAVSNDETAVVELDPPVIEPTVEVEFASSRELGGRIVQVKSENATLEWSGGGEQEQAR